MFEYSYQKCEVIAAISDYHRQNSDISYFQHLKNLYSVGHATIKKFLKVWKPECIKNEIREVTLPGEHMEAVLVHA